MKSTYIKKEIHLKFPKSDGWKFQVLKKKEFFEVYVIRGPYSLLDRGDVGHLRINRSHDFLFVNENEKGLELVQLIRDIESRFDIKISVSQGDSDLIGTFEFYGTLEDKMKLI